MGAHTMKTSKLGSPTKSPKKKKKSPQKHSKEVKAALDQRESALKRWESLSKVVFQPPESKRSTYSALSEEPKKYKRIRHKQRDKASIARRDPCALVNKIHDSFALIANEDDKTFDDNKVRKPGSDREICIPIADTFLLRSGQFLWWLRTSLTEGHIVAKQLSKFTPEMLLKEISKCDPMQYKSPTRIRRSSPRQSLDISLLRNNKLICVVRSRHKNKLQVTFRSYHGLVDLFNDKTAFARVISIQKYIAPLQTATSTGVYQNSFIRDNNSYHINFVTSQIHSSRSDSRTEAPSAEEAVDKKEKYSGGLQSFKIPTPIDTSFQPDLQYYIKSGESKTESATGKMKKHLSAYTSRIIRYIEKRWQVEVSTITVEYIIEQASRQPVFSHISMIQVSKVSTDDYHSASFEKKNPGVRIRQRQESFMGAKLEKVKTLHMMLGNRAKDGHLLNTKRAVLKPEPLAHLPATAPRERYRKPPLRDAENGKPAGRKQGKLGRDSQAKGAARKNGRPNAIKLPLKRPKSAQQKGRSSAVQPRTRPKSSHSRSMNNIHKQASPKGGALLLSKSLTEANVDRRRVVTKTLKQLLNVKDNKPKTFKPGVPQDLEGFQYAFHRVRTLLSGPTRDALSRPRCWGQFCDSMGQRYFNPTPTSKVVLRSILFAGMEGVIMQSSEQDWRPQQYFDMEDSDDETGAKDFLKIRIKVEASPEIASLATVDELVRTFRVKVSRCYEAVDVCGVCAEAYPFIDRLRTDGKMSALCGTAGVSSVELSGGAPAVPPSLGFLSPVKQSSDKETSLTSVIVKRPSRLLTTRRKTVKDTAKRIAFNPRHSMAQLVQDTGVSSAGFELTANTEVTRPVVPSSVQQKLNETLLRQSSARSTRCGFESEGDTKLRRCTSMRKTTVTEAPSRRNLLQSSKSFRYFGRVNAWDSFGCKPAPPVAPPVAKPLGEVVAAFVLRNGLPVERSSSGSESGLEALKGDDWSGSESSEEEEHDQSGDGFEDGSTPKQTKSASLELKNDPRTVGTEYKSSLKGYSGMAFRCQRIVNRLSKYPDLGNGNPPILALRRFEYLVPK